LLQRGIGRARYAIFDCLYVGGRDLRDEPLSRRRAELERSVHESDELILSRRLSANGLEAFRAAKQRGYEGLVTKRLASVYVEGRSREWLKVKVNQEDEFIILGYTEPSGSREYFGALLLGAHKNGKLQYVGRVGTGFPRDILASVIANFSPSNGNSHRSKIFLGPNERHFYHQNSLLRFPTRNGLRTEGYGIRYFSASAMTKIPKKLYCQRPSENHYGEQSFEARVHGEKVFQNPA
jgi:ATP-dependent DNA ligase